MRVISGTAKGHNLKAPKGMTTRPMADKIKGAVYSMLSNLLAPLDRDWGRVLDLYAGTGSIGIEALSRGAVWADFVEINAGVCRIISENLEHTHFSEVARVNNRSVAGFLNSPPAPPGDKKNRSAGGLHRRKGGKHRDPKSPLPPGMLEELIPEQAIEAETPPATKEYDIIFLDPPYADPKIPETIEHVARSGLVKPGGLVVVGHSPRVILAESYGHLSENSNELALNRIRLRIHGDSAFSIFLAGEPEAYGFGPESDSTETADIDELDEQE
jgi:16S rRNA G966 N2-methylase RsmD